MERDGRCQPDADGHDNCIAAFEQPSNSARPHWGVGHPMRGPTPLVLCGAECSSGLRPASANAS